MKKEKCTYMCNIGGNRYLSNKGFTLIELLAVIVILAIIALIATPIVLNIINETKKSSVKTSAEIYLDTVEKFVANETLKDNKNYDGTYVVSDNGHILTRDSETILNIEFNGNGIETGTFEIKNGKIVKVRNTMIQGYYVRITDGELTLYSNLPESKIVTGSSFNSLVKTLANGKSTSYDSAVTNIKFLPNGKIPIGYTEETLLNLDSVDVSLKKDGSVLALYDGNGTIYVYSENKIKSNEDLSNMFSFFSKLTNIDFEDFDTSEATSMNAMFYFCGSLTNLDLSTFDTSNVTNMYNMFALSGSLTIDLSNFDTSNVTNMGNMFSNCSRLTSLDVSNFDTSNVTNMKDMFGSCSSLTNLDVSNFNTSNVTNMASMFSSSSSLTSLDLSNFDTSNVTNMNGMFYGCSSLTSLDVSKFNTSKVTRMASMFRDCNNLANLDLSKFNTSNVTDIGYMFYNCDKLTTLDLRIADFNNVTSYNNMFYGVPSSITITVSNGTVGDKTTQEWIQERLGEGNGTIVVAS